MTCDVVPMPGGGNAIICYSPGRQRCACGKPATRLCDWKVPTKKSGTCDKPLCPSCTTSPTRGKDLCAAHVTAYADWQAQRVPELALSSPA